MGCWEARFRSTVTNTSQRPSARRSNAPLRIPDKPSPTTVRDIMRGHVAREPAINAFVEE